MKSMITPDSVSRTHSNCSDLNDLCSILLNCYVGDDSYICFIKSSPLLSNNSKKEGQIQMKKTNACIVDFTPPI